MDEQIIGIIRVGSRPIAVCSWREVNDWETQRVCEQVLRQEATANRLARHLPEITRQQMMRRTAR